MLERMRISSPAPWEAIIGYSRAVRVGNLVWTAGTTGTDASGAVAAPGDAYAQMRLCLEKIEAALQQVGARMSDVVRVDIFVTDISRWQDVGRAHAEFFRDVRPAIFMVEIRALIDPAMLVEVAVTAVVEGGGTE